MSTVSNDVEGRRLRVGRLESLSALAGGVTHEMSNLAASVMMSVQLLEPCCQHAADRQVLASLDELAHRLQHAGRQLHWLARGITGEVTVFQPQYLLTDLQRLARVAFPSSIAVITRYPPDLWPLAGDPLIVYQLLVALCIEARHRLPAGGTVVLAASNHELPGPALAGGEGGTKAVAARGGDGCSGRYVALEAIAEPATDQDAAAAADVVAGQHGAAAGSRTPGDPAARAWRHRAAVAARRAAAAAGGYAKPIASGSSGRGWRAYLPAAPYEEPV